MSPSERTATVAVSCNLCQSTDFTVLFGPGVAQLNQVVSCKRCGLLYANPRKEADHVAIESWPDDPSYDTARDPQRFEKERLQVRDYRGTRALLRQLHPDPGRLVEVGSSLGFLLDSFREDGWEVLGIDPDRYGCRHATGKLGIQTINSTLEAANLPRESVDVVLMMHVIEHVPDPVGTLREIHRVLKPGGHLVMETPRYDTLMFRLLGRRERSVSCDGHIFFFTVDSLRRAYESAAFELERMDYPSRSLTLDRLAFNLGVMSKSPTLQRIVGSLARRLRLQKIWLPLNFRDMQRVCLRKASSRGAFPERTGRESVGV
jgi:2-polyprenyl-3-methyl-5-hydroxy-6-metoxy-1,4-benzoquinol methylase